MVLGFDKGCKKKNRNGEKKEGREIYLGALVEENVNIRRTLKWWVTARFLEVSNTFQLIITKNDEKRRLSFLCKKIKFAT